MDHIFTFMAFVQKQLCLNRKLYVAFVVDFDKAFDSITRSILWPILNKNGRRGKLYRCIMSMCDYVKARLCSCAPDGVRTSVLWILSPTLLQ